MEPWIAKSEAKQEAQLGSGATHWKDFHAILLCNALGQASILDQGMCPLPTCGHHAPFNRISIVFNIARVCLESH